VRKQGSIKVSVIGVGHVGSLVGFVLGMRGLANEIVLCARDGDDERARKSQQKAAAEALDIKHATAFTSHRLEVYAGTSADTKGSDILVMTASEGMTAGITSRTDLAAKNTAKMRQLVPRLAGLSPDAIFVNVTNPVDVITYHIYQMSGFDWRKVIGTGTLIDTFRFRRRLADEMDINASDLRTYVIGEHGDTSLATLSNATIGGMDLAGLGDVLGIRRGMIADAEQEAKEVGTEVVRLRGYTNYAVAMAVEMIVDSMVNDRSSTLPVSVLLEGFCDVGDVCLSVPCVVSRGGVKQRLDPSLSEGEKRLFRESAAAVQKVIQKTQGPGSPVRPPRPRPVAIRTQPSFRLRGPLPAGPGGCAEASWSSARQPPHGTPA
jgi:L-lactate dehydrogenase